MRALERSTDGGKTWERFFAKPGSIMFHASFSSDGAPITDGFGNWYRLPVESPPHFVLEVHDSTLGAGSEFGTD